MVSGTISFVDLSGPVAVVIAISTLWYSARQYRFGRSRLKLGYRITLDVSFSEAHDILPTDLDVAAFAAALADPRVLELTLENRSKRDISKPDFNDEPLVIDIDSTVDRILYYTGFNKQLPSVLDAHTIIISPLRFHRGASLTIGILVSGSTETTDIRADFADAFIFRIPFSGEDKRIGRFSIRTLIVILGLLATLSLTLLSIFGRGHVFSGTGGGTTAGLEVTAQDATYGGRDFSLLDSIYARRNDQLKFSAELTGSSRGNMSDVIVTIVNDAPLQFMCTSGVIYVTGVDVRSFTFTDQAGAQCTPNEAQIDLHSVSRDDNVNIQWTETVATFARMGKQYRTQVELSFTGGGVSETFFVNPVQRIPAIASIHK